MHKHTANTSVCESKAKNIVNYSIFGGLIATNAGITLFLQFQENVEGTKHCK